MNIYYIVTLRNEYILHGRNQKLKHATWSQSEMNIYYMIKIRNEYILHGENKK